MVNYYIYAKDFSGSTSGSEFFHSNGMKSYEQFKSHVEKIKHEAEVEGKPLMESKIIYLHWGDQCYEVDENETVSSYQNLAGNMGTAPETIIHWLKNNYDICGENNKIKLLYIITDGLIDYNSADRCFELNEDMYYETVVFHAFNSRERSIDLSVAASFFKSRCMVYRNYKIFDNIDISEDFDYNKITVDNYISEKENLISYIKLKFIKTLKHDARALQEIDKLKKLRNRLFMDLSSKPKQNMTANLETKDKEVFMREFANVPWYQNLNSDVQDVKIDVEKSITTLINYVVNDQKSYSFDELKFDTKFSNAVEEESIAAVDVNFETEQEIQFPDIILDDEKGIPVIILNELNLLDKIIFHKTKDSSELSSASFNKFKSTMDCPLFLLNDQDVSESIGYFYTLNVYKQFLENSVKTEPRTRRLFHGGVVLVDSDEFDRYNDYILSATYFDSKKVNYNIGLFYFLLWKNSENKEWMDRNVVERFKKYAMRRVSTTVCKIGLSSLPLDPPEKTSLLTALWYCVELSSYIFKNDSKHFAQERLRMFYSVAHSMIEILQYFNYNLDLNKIKKRIDLIRNVMTLKRIPKYEEKVYYILEKIFKKINCFLICEIENPHYLNKLNYIKIDHKGLLSDDVIKEKVHLNEYVHLTYYTNVSGLESINICEKTFRPFFTIDKNKSFYSELVKDTKKVVINNDDDKDKIKVNFETIDTFEFDRIISLYNLFIKYVKSFEKYPSFQEYIDYIFKKRFYGTKVTIFPPSIYSGAEKTYSSYQNIIKNVEVSKFINVTKKYVSRSERIKAEGVVAFNDVEINEFIAKQESNVSFKRKK